MIVVLEHIHADALDLLTGAATVHQTTKPEFPDDIDFDSVQAIVTRGKGRVERELIEQLPNLQVVARCGVGLDNINSSAAADAGVVVVNTPGALTDSVAEHAVLLMLAAARQLRTQLQFATSDWAVRGLFSGLDLKGKRLGIIGAGDIGQRLGELGAAFGMDVVGWTRSPEKKDLSWPLLELNEVLATSDVIQMCIALTPATTGFISNDELSIMKPSSILVNTARGAVVDHEALGQSLAANSIGAYATDVWPNEPPLDRTLFEDDRVLVTPHIAALTDATFREICVVACQGVVDSLSS